LVAQIEQGEAYEIIKNVKTFKFKSLEEKGSGLDNLKDYYPDLGFVGRHFLVSTPELEFEGQTIHRHFTICNVMQKG